MTTFIILFYLQLLVCQRDFIDFENFLRNILFVFFVGCMHLFFISQHLMIFHRVLHTCGTLSSFEMILLNSFPLDLSMFSTLIQ